MVFKQIEDSLTTGEFNGIISLFRKHSPISYEVELQDNITTPYGNIELNLEDTILLDTGILISDETIQANPTIKLKTPSFPNSNYNITFDIIHYTGANIFQDTPHTYEVKDTITLNLPPNTPVPIPVENLQKDYIISLNALLHITHDKTVITGRPPVLTLTSDKTVLSAYNGDTTVLTAYYSQEEIPIPDTVVTFYNGVNSIGTATTDNNGEAHLTYTAVGSGDLSLTAKVGSLVSETYTIEDCLIAQLTETTITNTSGTKISSIGMDTLPNIQNTDFKLEFDQTGNGVLNIGSKNDWSSNSANYRLTIGYADGKTYWSVRTTSTNEGYGSNASTSTEYHYKIEREGTSVRFYVDDTLIQTRTVSFLSNYSTWSIYSIIWGNGTQKVKNIKLKPLGA